MQTNHFAVTDLETTGLSPIAEGEYKKAQITEISVHIINGHTLEINKDDHFHSLVWIEQDLKKCEELGLEPLSDEIAEKTHKDRKELLKAPKEEVVWEKLAQFLKKYRSKGNTNWNNPILAGWNCVGYDKKIIDVRAKQYGQWDLKYQDNTMFHPRDTLDGQQLAFYMFSHFPSIKSLSLDNIRKFLGLKPTELNHTANVDTCESALILARMLNYSRNNFKKRFFQNSMAKVDIKPYLEM